MRLRYGLFVTLLCCVLVLGTAAGTVFSQTPTPGEKPTPSIGPTAGPVPASALERPATGKTVDLPPIQGAPPLGVNFGAFDFLDNPTYNGGYLFIPPDPIGAAGPYHVVNVGNALVQWFDKVGTQQNIESLSSFFSTLGPPLGTFGFDPKVIYDQYSDRFVVIMLERTDTAAGDPADDSYVLVAVSKGSDPNLGWWFLAIHSKLNIGGYDTWADYPGLAVDDKAIYITTNMFRYYSGGGYYQGERLWIVHKAPLYSGGAPVWTVHDAYSAAGIAGFATTTMPTHMYGGLPANMGTFLCSYSGLTNGGPGASEFVGVIEVTDPLGTSGGPYFTNQFVSCGDIEDVGGSFGFPALADAPQLGTSYLVEVNDRRVLNAVWRDHHLYATTTITPNAGADAGQTTAHWWNLDTVGGIGAIATVDQGNVGAEDLGTGTFTFFPSVTVDKCDNMAIGFAASGPSIYPGAYYTGRANSDPPGTVQSTGVLHAGTDYYYRTFGGSRNRWGDYSGIALDPADQATFWVYNEYAMTRGTVLGSLPNEDGRWASHWGKFTLGCQTVAVAVTAFDARALEGAVELTGSLALDSDHVRVNVYRGDASMPQAVRYQSIELSGQTDFRYVDRNVEPGKTYRYYIGAVDGDGEFFSPTMEVTVPAIRTALGQNEPNPFNPITRIGFKLAKTTHVSLVIYDASGRRVRTLVDAVRPSGAQSVEWDGRDDAGRAVGSGIYFYRLKAGAFVESRKMTLLK